MIDVCQKEITKNNYPLKENKDSEHRNVKTADNTTLTQLIRD